MVQVWQEGTVVTSVAPLVIPIRLGVQLVRVGQVQAQTEQLKYATATDHAREVAKMMEEDEGIETTVISKVGDRNGFTISPKYTINAHRYNRDTLQVKEKKDKRGRNARPDGHWVVCKDMFGETVLKCTYPCQPPCRYTCKGTDNMKGHVNTVHIKKFMCKSLVFKIHYDFWC